MFKKSMAKWQKNFFTGLAVLLPIVLTVVLAVWLFTTLINLTSHLLFFLPFLPAEYTRGADGDFFWFWNPLALLVALLAVSLVGGLTRYYVGRKVVQAIDYILLSIPMLNKVYSTIKQVNNAFSSEKKTAFQQVVLVEFPRAGMHSIGFVTGHGDHELGQRTGQIVFSVFVPTTPNPTTGFLVLVPQDKVTLLNISVADGIKFLISLGSAPPEQAPAPVPLPVPVAIPATDEAATATEFITGVIQRAAAEEPPPAHQPPRDSTAKPDPKS